MKLDAQKFGIATACVFALLWLVCSALVMSMPDGMMRMSGHMAHADFNQMTWHLNWAGFLFGLVAWSALAGLTAWAIAAVYNRLIG